MGFTRLVPLQPVETHHSEKLQKLRHYFPVQAAARYSIPVRADADLSAYVAPTHTPASHTANEQAPTVADDATPPTLVSLRALAPTCRLHQLTTAYLGNFPALKPALISKALLLLADSTSAFVFALVGEPLHDTRALFVRFSLVAAAQCAKQRAPKVFPGIDVTFNYDPTDALSGSADVVAEAPSDEVSKAEGSDSGKPDEKNEIEPLLETSTATETVLETDTKGGEGTNATESGNEIVDATESVKTIEGSPELEAVEQAAAEVARIFANRNYYEASRSGTEDLDQVALYYKTYKVENLELVEVPRSMRSAIVDDILYFRSRVLAQERAAREADLERERQRARARLTKIFDSIRGKENGENTSAAPQSELIDPAAEVAATSDDELDDDAYKAKLKSQEEAAHQAAMAKAMAVLARREAEQNLLLARLKSTESYETDLIKNKFDLVDEVKAAAEAGLPRNPRDYFKKRAVARTREESLDKEDEALESREADVKRVRLFTTTEASRSEQSLGPLSEANLAHEANSSSLPTVAGSQPSVAVGALEPAKLEKVKEKIASLIEEYLGIREDLLIDFVYQHLLDHSLTKREELISELQETLDEDSQTVVSQLYDFVQAL